MTRKIIQSDNRAIGVRSTITRWLDSTAPSFLEEGGQITGPTTVSWIVCDCSQHIWEVELGFCFRGAGFSFRGGEDWVLGDNSIKFWDFSDIS